MLGGIRFIINIYKLSLNLENQKEALFQMMIYIIFVKCNYLEPLVFHFQPLLNRSYVLIVTWELGAGKSLLVLDELVGFAMESGLGM